MYKSIRWNILFVFVMQSKGVIIYILPHNANILVCGREDFILCGDTLKILFNIIVWTLCFVWSCLESSSFNIVVSTKNTQSNAL